MLSTKLENFLFLEKWSHGENYEWIQLYCSNVLKSKVNLFCFTCISIRNTVNHMIFTDLEMLKFCPKFWEKSCDFIITWLNHMLSIKLNTFSFFGKMFPR